MVYAAPFNSFPQIPLAISRPLKFYPSSWRLTNLQTESPDLPFPSLRLASCLLQHGGFSASSLAPCAIDRFRMAPPREAYSRSFLGWFTFRFHRT